MILIYKRWVRWHRCLPSSDSVPKQAFGSSGFWSRSCCTLNWFTSPLAAPSSSWVSVYVPSGRSTRLHAHALDYGEGERITTKSTLVGHIHPNNIIFLQKLLVCVINNKILFWWWLCAHLSNLSYLTSPNSKGVVTKYQKQNQNMISQI
jgi:hypothetical protein